MRSWAVRVSGVAQDMSARQIDIGNAANNRQELAISENIQI
jgi:hypothetical protein